MDIIQQAIEQTLNSAQRHHQAGRLRDAEVLYRQVLASSPRHPQAHLLLGALALQAGNCPAAIELLKRATELMPAHFAPFAALSNAYLLQDYYDLAIPAAREAIRLNSGNPKLVSNLASLMNYTGHATQAIDLFRRAHEMKPDDPELHSNLLFQMHVLGSLSPEAIREQHLKWDAIQSARVRVLSPPVADRDPDRPLRVGYVSPDLRDHAVAVFFEPLLENHDRAHIQPFCYASVIAADAVSKRLMQKSHAWRDIRTLSDDQAADLIRKDQIDILIDLGGHTSDNRLSIFLRRPAPVQMAWLGYPSTTGVSAIDYRITDVWLDPPGQTEKEYSEKLLRLPETFAVYRPTGDIPEVADLPASRNGYVTFGSAANIARLNPDLFQTWAQILRQVPHSRIRFIVAGLEHNDLYNQAFKIFSEAGIDKDRLLIRGRASKMDLFTMQNEIDVGLDTFPQSGHTMFCQALWMGVPAVCIAGDTSWRRLGTSVLQNIGLGDLITHSRDQYIARAVALASDTTRLTELRKTLRHRMKNSPLMNETRFAQNMEHAYRTAWQNACTQKELI